MDNVLSLYKGKLKEALNLVASMGQVKKIEAVAYWNSLAAELQELVQKSDNSEYDHVLANDVTLSTRLDGSDVGQIYAAPPVCDTHILSTLVSSAPTTNALDSAASIKGQCMDQFQRDLIDRSIYDPNYISAPSSVEECKQTLNNLHIESESNINDLGVAVNDYALNQASLNCASSATMSGPAACPTSVIETNSIANQTPHGRHETILNVNTNLTGDVFCPGVMDSGAPTIIGYVSENSQRSPPSNGGFKIEHNGVHASPEFDKTSNNHIDIPRTMADVSEEYGSGQYDRGPKQIFESVPAFSPATGANNQQSNHSTAQYISPQAILSSKNEPFTQSDRPLQSIQLYNFNSLPICSFCNQQFTTEEDLLIHTKLHLRKEIEQPNLNAEVPRADVRRPGNDTVINPPTEKVNTCEVCGKSGFSTKGNLKRHLRAHSGEKPFKCEYCESCFTEKKSLKIHVRRHTGEKPYKCQICEKLFSQTGVLQSHMALHLNERKFNCDKCGKAFRQRSQLKLHKMRHDGVKRLECLTCHARFLTKGDLERHCRIHTGERPYACEICKKTFTRQQSLNEHMNRHTGRRPYDCKYCEKTFSEMSACYKHAKTHKLQNEQFQPNVLVQKAD